MNILNTLKSQLGAKWDASSNAPSWLSTFPLSSSFKSFLIQIIAIVSRCDVAKPSFLHPAHFWNHTPNATFDSSPWSQTVTSSSSKAVPRGPYICCISEKWGDKALKWQVGKSAIILLSKFSILSKWSSGGTKKREGGELPKKKSQTSQRSRLQELGC